MSIRISFRPASIIGELESVNIESSSIIVHNRDEKIEISLTADGFDIHSSDGALAVLPRVSNNVELKVLDREY